MNNKTKQQIRPLNFEIIVWTNKSGRPEYTHDWNKFWPSADKVFPAICLDCGLKLEKPKHKYKILMPKSDAFPNMLVSSHEGQTRIDCKCGACYIWSFPNVYIKTHRLLELLMFINDFDKSLLRPMDVVL